MRYSIFGSKGRIGSAVISSLSNQKDIEINAVPREFDKSDLRGLGHVIFAAGLTADFRQRPYDTMRAHVDLISQILEFGSFESLTYLSSTRLYEHANTTSVDTTFNVDPANPSDIYTLSKLSGEALCMQANESVRIARLSNVVGPNEVGQQTFIGMISKQALDGSIKFLTTPDSEKDYVWLYDVVRLLIDMPFIATQKCYNFARGENITNQAWADALKANTGCDFSYEDAAKEIRFPIIDIKSTNQDFDFKPSSPIEKLNDICQLPPMH